jgi:hypothetical protein
MFLHYLMYVAFSLYEISPERFGSLPVSMSPGHRRVDWAVLPDHFAAERAIVGSDYTVRL